MVSNVASSDTGVYHLALHPQLIRTIATDFSNSQKSNYLRGCKWSPDGSCLLTCSQDNCLRVFELEYITNCINNSNSNLSALCLPEPELVYDYIWYPGMNSNEPITNCIASIARDNPIHLWDAYTGDVRCSYLLLNHLQEVITPYSLLFSADGRRLYCGYKHSIKYFLTDKPGANSLTIKLNRTFTSDKNGIISSLVLCASNSKCLAAGTYGGKVLLIDCKSEYVQMTLQAQLSGVNLVKFSSDGNFLFSGARGSNDILIWDIRYTDTLLAKLTRDSVTQQLIEYDMNDSYIVSGNKDGTMSVWDTNRVLSYSNNCNVALLNKYKLHNDVINGVSLNSKYSILATASGEKLFNISDSLSTNFDTSDTETLSSCNTQKFEHCVKLWNCHS